MKFKKTFLLTLPLFACASGVTQDQKPYFKMTTQSGFVPPEGAFQTECKISRKEASCVSKRSPNEAGVWKTIEKKIAIDPIEFDQKIENARQAEKSKIDKKPYPCDAGTKAINAMVSGSEFVLKADYDCDGSYTNTSLKANELIEWVRAKCQLCFK